MPLRELLVVLLVSSAAVSSSDAQDATTILRNTLQKYKNLTAYHVEGTRETTVSWDMEHKLERQNFVLAKAPGKRYHYDLKTPDIWNIVIADGATEWEFQPWINEYSRRNVPELTALANGPSDEIRAFMARQAQTYVDELSGERIQDASTLRDETITIAGQAIPCQVIRARIGRSEHDPRPDPLQATFWIEKVRGVVRKETIAEQVKYPSPLRPLREVNMQEATYYTIVDLGGQPPRELFQFAPPSDATAVPRLFINDKLIDLSGFPAPPLKLETFEGKPFDVSSLKGHAVLLDFWASWCVPCVQQMQGLATIAAENKSTLTVIGINSDDDPTTALDFLRKNKYGWTNLRDVDGQTAKSWRVNGIPVVAIGDSGGTVAYNHFGYEQPEEVAINEVLQRIKKLLN